MRVHIFLLVAGSTYKFRIPYSFTAKLQVAEEHKSTPGTISDFDWYGTETYPTNSNQNHYDLFNAGGMKFIVVYLDFYDFALPPDNQILRPRTGDSYE